MSCLVVCCVCLVLGPPGVSSLLRSSIWQDITRQITLNWSPARACMSANTDTGRSKSVWSFVAFFSNQNLGIFRAHSGANGTCRRRCSHTHTMFGQYFRAAWKPGFQTQTGQTQSEGSIFVMAPHPKKDKQMFATSVRRWVAVQSSLKMYYWFGTTWVTYQIIACGKNANCMWKRGRAPEKCYKLWFLCCTRSQAYLNTNLQECVWLLLITHTVSFRCVSNYSIYYIINSPNWPYNK